MDGSETAKGGRRDPLTQLRAEWIEACHTKLALRDALFKAAMGTAVGKAFQEAEQNERRTREAYARALQSQQPKEPEDA